MGIFGKTKVERLLLRLFGYDNVHCMNIQDCSGGLLAELKSETSDVRRGLEELREQIKEDLNEMDNKIYLLEKPKKKKAKKKK